MTTLKRLERLARTIKPAPLKTYPEVVIYGTTESGERVHLATWPARTTIFLPDNGRGDTQKAVRDGSSKL